MNTKKGRKPKKIRITEHFIVDDVVYFELKGRAKQENILAMVSLDMWDWVSKYDWYLSKTNYPVCYELGNVQLHRFVYRYILKDTIPEKFCVDHIDRNKLNNTNGNLRLATSQENAYNRSTKSNKKGVRKISGNNYSAIVYKDGKKHEIKNLATEQEAANMYNFMAEDLFGEFAAMNIIDDDTATY